MIDPHLCFLIGIAGGSGSGKTTFAQKVIRQVTGVPVGLIHQDSYYLPTIPDELRVNGEVNFDHPQSFDWSLLKEHLRKVKAGEGVSVPTYDFKLNTRKPETIDLGPCHVLLLEGIFALWDPEIRDLFDVRVFLNVESDIRFIRRLHRDVQERGRTLDSIIKQYYDVVRPMHHKFIEPTRQYADVIVGDETDIASQVLAAKVRLAGERPLH